MICEVCLDISCWAKFSHYEGDFGMKQKFILPTSETFWEFSDFPIPISGGSAEPPTFEEFISKYLFWSPLGFSNLASTQTIFDDYLGILLLAKELIVSKQQLEMETKSEHKQFCYQNSHIWELLLEKECISLFDVYSLNQSTREKIFRQASELTIQIIEDHARSKNISKTSKIPQDFMYFMYWICTVRNILVNLLYANEIDATILWSPKKINEVNWVLRYLERRNLINENKLPSSVLYYHSILPHIPLIEHDYSTHTQHTYPENVERVAELREDERIRLLGSILSNVELILQNEEKTSDWIEEFNSIATEIEANMRQQRIVTTLMGSVGIGLGITGIVNVVAGIAGVSVTLATPLIDILLNRQLKNMEERFPYYTEIFKLKKSLQKQTMSYSKKNKQSARKVWYHNSPSFLEELESRSIRHEKGTQYCMAITKSGHLCRRKAKDGDFFCSLHS